MTLLIALMANAIYAHEIGQPFIDTGWIVVIWIIHLLCRGSSSS